jgi:hypothetical protein
MENPLFRENQFEHSLTYVRDDGLKVEVALIHLPGSEPVFRAATFEEGQDEPVSISPVHSLEEIRMRAAFYEQLKADGLL